MFSTLLLVLRPQLL